MRRNTFLFDHDAEFPTSLSKFGPVKKTPSVSAAATPVIKFRQVNIDCCEEELVRSGFFTKVQYPVARRIIRFIQANIREEEAAEVISQFLKVIQTQAAPPAAANPVIKFIQADRHLIDEEGGELSQFLKFIRVQAVPPATAKPVIKFSVTEHIPEEDFDARSGFFAKSPTPKALPVITPLRVTPEEAEYQDIRSQFFAQPKFQAAPPGPASPVIAFRIGQWSEDGAESFDETVTSPSRFYVFVSTRPVTPATIFYLGGTFTTATRPGDASAGSYIFVSDGGAGSEFQGWNGSTWVSLG